MNLETVTVSDLLDNYYRRGRASVLSNGKVVGFVHEENVPVIITRTVERRMNGRGQEWLRRTNRWHFCQ